MSDPSPSTLTVLNSNFLQLGRRSGGRPQRTVYPRRLPVNTVIHTTLAGFEPTTSRLLVRHATSSTTDSQTTGNHDESFKTEPGIDKNLKLKISRISQSDIDHTEITDTNSSINRINTTEQNTVVHHTISLFYTRKENNYSPRPMFPIRPPPLPP